MEHQSTKLQQEIHLDDLSLRSDLSLTESNLVYASSSSEVSVEGNAKHLQQ